MTGSFRLRIGIISVVGIISVAEIILMVGIISVVVQQRSRFSHIRAVDRVLPAPPNPTTSQATQDSQMETTGGKDSANEISEDTPPA